jgi:hypothetical protein
MGAMARLLGMQDGQVNPLPSPLEAAGVSSKCMHAAGLYMHTLSPSVPAHLCSLSVRAGYIDVEADEIAPGYAVLLMYMMLVRRSVCVCVGGEGGSDTGTLLPQQQPRRRACLCWGSSSMCQTLPYR